MILKLPSVSRVIALNWRERTSRLGEFIVNCFASTFEMLLFERNQIKIIIQEVLVFVCNMRVENTSKKSYIWTSL